MHLSTLLYSVIFAAVAQQQPSMPASVEAIGCNIFLSQEAKVPAQEPGLILELKVKEGQVVRQGESLVQLDDSIPKEQVNVAQAELDAAEFEAKTDIPKKYAEASFEVAKKVYQISVDANKRVPDTVPPAELKKQYLEVIQMDLSIKKADVDMKIAEKKVDIQKAKLQAAKTQLEHYHIRSPYNGAVRKLYHHVGEWAQNGEAVVHVVSLDRLHVEGYLNAAEISPSEVIEKPVKVKVELARGGSAVFQGNIIFVDSQIDTDDQYMVRAEVENRQDNNGQWVIQPGMTSSMTIQLK